MCGFVGVINSNLNSEITLRLVKDAQYLIAHRGEDSQEIY